MPSNSTSSTLRSDIQVIGLAPIKIAKLLGFIVLVLLLAYIVAMMYESRMQPAPGTFSYYLVRLFDVNHEANLPALFSVLILLLASLLLFGVSYFKNRNREEKRKWVLLGFVFLFLAADENLQIHEQLAERVRPLLASDLSGLLYWAWVVPYGVLVVAGGAYFLPFILKLPAKTKWLFIFSGVLFVSGALGLELFEGYFYVRYGYTHIYNLVLYCLEEGLEMSGVVVFIYALLDHLNRLKAQVLFRLTTDNPEEVLEEEAAPHSVW